MNLPWRSRRQLLAGNQARIQPAMKCGSSHAENLGSFHDWNRLPQGRFAGRLKARDLMITPQAAHLVCRETLAVRRLPTLAIENAGNGVVGVISRQSA